MHMDESNKPVIRKRRLNNLVEDIRSPQKRIFRIGQTAHLYPSFVRSDPSRLAYRWVCKFFIASTRQFWFFFAAWTVSVLIMVFRLQEYAFWLLGAMSVVLMVTTVLEWNKLSELEDRESMV
jgi:ABC-type protease/lipase transport system fused ATPase/permease subunit